MSDASFAVQPVPRPLLVERVTGAIALIGGILSLAVATLVVVSVTGRWLSGTALGRAFPWLGPIPGDFELVQMGTAVSIFSFLSYCQARRGNIFVDTFTTRLSKPANARIDAVWDVVYAAMMTFVGVCLATGAVEHYRSGQTTMLLQLIVWPALAICAALTFVLAATALATAAARLGRGT